MLFKPATFVVSGRRYAELKLLDLCSKTKAAQQRAQ